MNNIVPFPSQPVDIYRMSTDAASLCREIVLRTAQDIQGRRYVRVEGWQAIATAHACMAGSCDVQEVEGGVRAIGEIRRISDGQLLARAEGFVGRDEPVWFGGMMRKWKWGQRRGEKVWYDEEMPKRADYAIRAMAQTRAISRACRSAFAHVVVLIDANLSTTPAEEVTWGDVETTWGDVQATVIDQPATAQDIPNADHPYAPRPEPSPARPATARASMDPQPRPGPSAASLARPAGLTPAPMRQINRIGARVPAPRGELPQDWQRWVAAIGNRIRAGKDRDEVTKVGKDHADDIARCEQVLPGSAHSLSVLTIDRLAELNGKAA